MYTTASYALDHVTLSTEQKSFIFTVDACKDIHIYLSHVPGVLVDQAYEISLGTSDNTQSSITKSLPDRENRQFTTNGILGCDPNGKSLWISWSEGDIKVGQGSVTGQGQLFSWTDSQPYNIHALAIASRDTAQTVKWTFLRESGQ